jgi:DNA-binding response OmpR family regulator
MDGLAFLRIIRNRPGWKSVPVIMLSGLMSREQIAEASSLGVTDQLTKGDFSMRDLRARVAKCVSSGSTATQSNVA